MVGTRLVKFPLRASSTSEARGLIASILLVAVVYGRGLGYGFVRDGEEAFAAALGLTDLTGVWTGFLRNLSAVVADSTVFSTLWRPTVNLAVLGAGWIGGGEAWAFRLVSLTALVVLGWAARRLVGRGMGRDLVLCLVVFHPMMSAAVLDITALPMLLMATFTVLALNFQGRKAFVFTLIAMGAHEAAAMTPLLAIAFARGGDGERRSDARWQGPILAVFLWWAVLGGMFAGGLLGRESVSIPTAHGALDAAAQAWFYLERLVFPFSPLYARTAPVFHEPWPGVAWLGLLVALWLALRTGNARPRPVGPGFAAGFTCILLSLLGMGGLLSESPGYGEGRLALPIVGFAWMVASRPPVRAAGWTLVPLFAVLSVLRVGVWSDPNQLWAESHRARPNDTMVALEYGQRLITTNSAMAVGLFSQVLAGSPSDTDAFRAHVGAIQARFELGDERGALPHLAATADPEDDRNGWLLVRRCILETRYSVDEALYPVGTVLSPLVRVCGEASARFPRHARLANAAGIEAAIRGDVARAQSLIQRAVELAPNNAEYRKTFSRIPMNTLGWISEDPLSPDPAAAP